MAETWAFDFEKFITEQRAIWHKNVRTMTRPAIILGKDLYYVDEDQDVIKVDEDTLLAGGYWTSPMLNRGNRIAEYTLARVVLRYECEGATTLTITASGDGGVTWSAGHTPTVALEDTQGSVRRVIQGFNVTGEDLRFKVALPSDSLVLLRSWRAEIIERGTI